MTDIVERLRRKVFHGPTMEASHTKTVEWQAADEIERLRAALVKAREPMQWLAENERECLGVVPMDDGSEVPAIWIAVADIDAALGGE